MLSSYINYIIKQLCSCIILVLIFFSCTQESLPELRIKKDSVIRWDTKEKCEITFVINNDSVVSTAGIKARGGMSSRYGKHSYSLELDKHLSFCGIKADDDWILNASYIDKTFMRHKLSYDLYREMNKKNIAPECAYVNLIENGKEQGLYILMQEVNGAMVGLEKSDSLSMVFKDPPVYYEGRTKYFQDSANYYQQKYPKIDTSDKTFYIEKFREVLFFSEDDEFLSSIAEWIDMDNVKDWHLLLLLTNNSDGIMKNFLLYKINKQTPFRIALWDYDHSFGRDGDNELNMMERELDCNRSILLKRLMSIPESNYRIELKKRWKELRKSGIISEKNILSHIKKNNGKIKLGIENNCSLWPYNSKWYYDDNSYLEEVEIIKKFVEMRIPHLDSYFEKLK